MLEPDWRQAEGQLLECSNALLRRFGREHPEEPISLFAYTIDSGFSGVALNFDSLANSLARAQDHQRRVVRDRNRLFAEDDGWRFARDQVIAPGRQLDDFNRDDSWSHESVEFVPLTVWEELFDNLKPEDDDAGRDLENRVITSLWRVVDRLVITQAFDALTCGSPFRVGFAFHDAELVVLRVLNWPTPASGSQC